MIDTNLLFWLELSALAILVGVSIWHMYRIQHSGTINASAPVVHDMRQDAQRLSLQTDPP